MLQALKLVRESIFTADAGMRPDVRKVLVVVTVCPVLRMCSSWSRSVPVALFHMFINSENVNLIRRALKSVCMSPVSHNVNLIRRALKSKSSPYVCESHMKSVKVQV